VSVEDWIGATVKVRKGMDERGERSTLGGGGEDEGGYGRSLEG